MTLKHNVLIFVENSVMLFCDLKIFPDFYCKQNHIFVCLKFWSLGIGSGFERAKWQWQYSMCCWNGADPWLWSLASPHCPKSNPNFRDITWNVVETMILHDLWKTWYYMNCGKHDTTWTILRSITFSPLYRGKWIFFWSVYIAVDRPW